MSINIVVYNGLCNRLIPFMSCYRIAKKYNRKMNVLWNGPPVRSCLAYVDNRPCLFEDIFDDLKNVSIVDEEEFQKLEKKSDKVYHFHYEKCKKLIIEPEKYENISIYLALYPILLEDDLNIDIDYIEYTLDSANSRDGLFENQIMFEFKNVFKELKPKPELMDIIDGVSSKFTNNMIGLHIRKTDGSFSDMDWDGMDKVLIPYLKNLLSEQNDLSIFLATDCKKTHSKYNFYLKDRLISYSPGETKFENNRFNVICGVVDMYLLSKCNVRIIGTVASSFSMTSGILSSAPLWLLKNKNSPLP